MINIKITLDDGRNIDRNYEMTDAQLPDNMQENLQDMVDTLLDNQEGF